MLCRERSKHVQPVAGARTRFAIIAALNAPLRKTRVLMLGEGGGLCFAEPLRALPLQAAPRPAHPTSVLRYLAGRRARESLVFDFWQDQVEEPDVACSIARSDLRVGRSD
jgi:hypothetical protein